MPEEIITTKRIAQLEAMVNKIGDCYDMPEESDVAELNRLTGNDWSAKSYWDYCCEYWSHHSLEETVWALLHDGNYPHCEEIEVCFFKKAGNSTLKDKEIYEAYRLGREKKISKKMEKLPVEQIEEWIRENFTEWQREENSFKPKENDLSSCTFIPKDKKEYGIEHALCFYSYSKQMICLNFINISEDEQSKIIDYIKSLNITFAFRRELDEDEEEGDF